MHFNQRAKAEFQPARTTINSQLSVEAQYHVKRHAELLRLLTTSILAVFTSDSILLNTKFELIIVFQYLQSRQSGQQGNVVMVTVVSY